MSELNAAEKLKYNKLSSEDTVLYDNGLINLDGDITDAGKLMGAQYALQNYKTQIVADLSGAKPAASSVPSSTQE